MDREVPVGSYTCAVSHSTRKKISRRGFAKLTGAGGIAAAVTGCGGIDSGDDSDAAGTGERPFEAIPATELPQPNISSSSRTIWAGLT